MAKVIKTIEFFNSKFQNKDKTKTKVIFTMSMRFYNPPPALLARGTKEGVEIGGALSVLAMDEDHNLRNVKTIFSELSWGQFWKEEEIADQIESITVKHEDNATLWDSNELLKRLLDAFKIIKENKWIFFGIGDFESNSFQDEMLIDGLDYSYIERLMDTHKRVRDADKFPTLLDKNLAQKGRDYISLKFNGSAYNFFHYDENTDLYTIFEKLKPITGNAAGIVCTSRGAANFYILTENMHSISSSGDYRIDTKTLEDSFALMTKNIIFPISWFKINIGLSALKKLDQWEEIKKDKNLARTLYTYFTYVTKELKVKHEKKKEKKKTPSQMQSVDVNSMTDNDRKNDLRSLESVLGLKDLGLFRK